MTDIQQAIAKDAADAQARRAAIATVLRSQEWGWFMDYLEKRYIELVVKDCNGVKAVAERYGRMKEIEGIFAEVGSELSLANMAKAKFDNMRKGLQEEAPDIADENIQF